MVTRVSGNTTYYALALRQLIFTDGSKVEEDFSPEQTDVVRVVLHGGRAYEYTPTVSGNLLQFADEGGTLPIGSYDVEVLIDREGGHQLRAMQRGGLLIVEASGDALAYSSEAKLDAQTFIISSTGDISALENRVAACERTDVAQNEAIGTLEHGMSEIPTTFATKEEMRGYALNRTQYHEDHVQLEQVNNEYVQVNAATEQTAGVMSAVQVKKLSGKQAKVLLVAQASAPATLTPAIDTYTRIGVLVGTMAIQLPAIPVDTTTALALSIYMETGANPQVTFTSADNTPIAYFDGFALDANGKYEISAMYNGSKWILAHGTIA